MNYSKTNLNEFKRLAQQAGSGVGVPLRRAGVLKDLVALLGNNDISEDEVVDEIVKLAGTEDTDYGNKANKYKTAIYHLELTLPIQQNKRVAVKPKTSNAFRLNKGGSEPTIKEGGWKKGDPFKPELDPEDPTYWSLKPNSVNFSLPASIESLSGTVEDFIMKHPATPVLMIHLQSPLDEMKLKFDGFSSTKHMNSVLNVARRTASPVCALRVTNADPVCDALKHEYNQFASKIQPHSSQHSGFHNSDFQDWVAGKDNIVVMGYEADMCVHQNIFGGGELAARSENERKNKVPAKLVSALMAHTNVITSRPLLITPSPIRRGEYGKIREIQPH